jgi:hypothetical protein
VWGNLHGTVLLGVALSLAWSAWRLVESVRLRDRVGSFAYATVGLASAGAIFANPYGISIVHYYAALIGNGTVSHYIVEWASPSLGNPFSAVYFAIGALAVGVTSYAYGKGARPQMSLVAGAALLGVLSATGVRYQAWFVLAAVFLAASALAAVESPAPLAPRIEGLVSAFAVVFALVTLVVLVRTSDRTFERLSPRGELAATAAYVARHPQARVLADENASSALLWMFPATQGNVGFDARLEQYPVPALRRWLSFLSIDSPEWLRVLRGYDVVVVTRADRPELARRLLQLRGWRTLAASDDGIVRVRAAR